MWERLFSDQPQGCELNPTNAGPSNPRDSQDAREMVSHLPSPGHGLKEAAEGPEASEEHGGLGVGGGCQGRVIL